MHPNLHDPADIVHELQQKGFVEENCTISAPMKGTTNGFVYLLSVADKPSYVLKVDDPQQNYITARFLTGYGGNPLLPRLVYADPHNAYLVYAYISGETSDTSREAKIHWLNRIAQQLISAYVVAEDHHGWGYMDEPVDSWSEFLMDRLQGAHSLIGEWLPEEDYALVQLLVGPHEDAILDGPGPEPSYWLHGDCGVHNFIFRQGELSGVIDPSPVIGPPLYDLVFAFCSSPDDLSPDTLFQAADGLKDASGQPIERALLLREAVIQLYCRIGVCLLHHPEDLPAYLDAWSEWKRYVV